MSIRKIRESIMLKLVAIGALILILLIPAQMIQFTIEERESTRNEAIEEVSAKWGRQQTIVGPILTVPYTKTSPLPNQPSTTDYINFLPDSLNINGVIQPESLQRGIYQIVAYNSQLQIDGEFSFSELSRLNIAKESVNWNDAYFSVVIPDTRGINQQLTLKWDNADYRFFPSSKTQISPDDYGLNGITNSGINTKISIDPNSIESSHKFAFSLDINGTKQFNFVPVGKETNIKLSSKWNSPSFDGAFLPDKREISDNGFSAEWKVLELNRSIPQSWLGNKTPLLGPSVFGVKLLIPIDEYQKNTRSVKYAIMLISLTFLIFFFVEILNKIRIHPIQYILVGLALVLFYSLLLSLSEHINFNLAYLLASIATIILITLYSRTIFKNTKISLLQGGILFFIYVFIFTIIQLEDYALLMGSLGLFCILAVVMFISRKIDWYAFSVGNTADCDVPQPPKAN